MATIGTAIRLNDMMSEPIMDINESMEEMLSTWHDLDEATSDGLNVRGVEGFHEEVQKGTNAVDNMTGKVIGLVSAYASMQTVKKLVNMSDEFTQTTARLNMVNDGMQTTEELTDKIFASAQRARAGFTDMADTVAKLSLNAGDAFSSNDETILFAENLNKLFAIAGTEQASIASASLQLTQALGSGVLRGEEFNAVFEAAPNIMQTVADYMGVPIGSLRDMAAEGQITGDIVKNALLSATGEINAEFESMPMTWGQVWTGITNELYYATIPLLELISGLAQNWAIIEPIVIGVATALAIYLAATKGVELATKAWAAAQAFFNSVMALNPVFLVIMGVVLLVSLIYAAVAAYNKFTDSTVSATGIIMGALAVAGAFIVNLVVGVFNGLIQLLWTLFAEPFLGVIEWILNVFMGGFDSFGGAVANLIGQIIGWFLSLGKVVTKIIDAIFGTDWTSGLSSLQDSVISWGKTEDAITLDRTAPTIDYRMDYGNAWDTGYEFGEGLGDKVGGLFGGNTESEYGMDGLLNSVGDIETNTADTADALEITNEDLKYMRDIAEQEVINRFTTAEVRVEMGGITNQVNNTMDLDGVVDYVVTGVQEAMERVAEGVHD